MHTVLQALAVGLLVVVVLLLIGTGIAVARGRPPQPPRSRGEAARVRGTFIRARSYQAYVLRTIRDGSRARRRR